jgi:hypothetical protein
MNPSCLDTEFNSHGAELISIARASDDGNEFYGVVGIPAQPHPWVLGASFLS